MVRNEPSCINGMKEWKSPFPAVFLFVDDVLEEDTTEEEEKQNTNNLTYCQEQQLQELKEKFAGVISNDPGRAAPVVLVPKKDSSKLLCIDYRKLNLITRADPYPIPRLEDLIDDIGREKYITALDLTKGYWQVPVAKSSQDKTAFITPWGKIPVPDHAIWTSSCSLDISAVDGHDSRRNTLICSSLPGRCDNPQQHLG